MRTIPAAIAWEFLRRSWWKLPAAIVGANAFPAMVLIALHSELALMPNDPNILILHVVLMQISMLILGAAVFSIQGSPARLYTYPVRNATIVACHLLPVMVIMFVETVLSTLLINALFGTNWPLWGPTFFLAVTVAAIDAVHWLTEKSGWLAVGVVLVVAVLGFWFKMRYGSLTGQPDRLWTVVTWDEALTMLGIACLAFAVGVFAVGRNRRGEPPLSVGIIDWITQAPDITPTRHAAFRTPWEAQLWFEWRQKGWALPAAVTFGLVCGFFLWLLFSRHGEDLFTGMLAGGGLISAAGVIVGLIVGNCGQTNASFEIGQFRATRPLTSTEIARAILQTAAKSVLLAWGIWFFALLILLISPYVFRLTPGNINVQDIAAILVATLVGAWIVVSVIASLAMTGRARLVTGSFIFPLTVFVAWTLYSTNMLPAYVQIQFNRAIMLCRNLSVPA